MWEQDTPDRRTAGYAAGDVMFCEEGVSYGCPVDITESG